eukprot:Gregarina_sp_Pseudo_9__2527@NODE_27_length_5599_cov_16_826439_g25_i0_p3_GENE_NODE_27_length_5599_cov_16_826439_g25_i0NODE_27_length_5599_cov_16_826439_g25_i0_p3_ORF_typecomplete_len512_score101_08PP2C/PF00481_21/6_4e47PP2C_2/PF13672_6/1_3e13SpoIIE/PF07228_12/1_6SpoIIE/PF07228_12/0_038DUF3613/PF12266_8/0_3_NODE_27_length_5599_cov_16_826439_g25_i040145549
MLLLNALRKGTRKFDNRVVLCEAPHTHTLAETPHTHVLTETPHTASPVPVHLDQLRNDKPLSPMMTPRRLFLNPLPSSTRDAKKDAKNSEEFFLSSPVPSAWPSEWALFQVNSNYPIEDRAFVSVHPIKKTFLDETPSPTGWLCATVIDGHSGWQTAEYVQKSLGSKMEKHISGIKETNLTATNVASALTKCFESLDQEIRSRIEPAFSMGYHMVAKPGATTCACLFSPSKIICANVGDTMAVLCRGGCAIKLSNEHNCAVPSEGEKMRRLHPNEPDIVYDHSKDPKRKQKQADKEDGNNTCDGSSCSDSSKSSVGYGKAMMDALTCWLRAQSEPTPTRPACYLKGRLQLTRAFGDFYLKELKYAQDVTNNKCLVQPPYSFPYLSCTPEVSVIDRDTANDEFVLIATDGLWDWVTPAEVCAFIRPLLRKGHTATDCVDRLKTHMYEKWVNNYNQQKDSSLEEPWTIEKLMSLAPTERRRKFDDMTISLINLQQSNTAAGGPTKSSSNRWWL